MRKLLAYLTLAGALGMLCGIGAVLLGVTIGKTWFIAGAVLCFGGELILKYSRSR